MGFFRRFGKAWKASTLSPGERAPLPRLSYPSFISGLASFSDLYSRHRPVDPDDANEGRDNAIVAICINYIATSWAVAVPQVGHRDGDKFVPNATRHPFLDILESPNEMYSGDWLTWALNTDYWRKGNAYAHIVKNRRGEVLELNWLPARYTRPVPDDSGYLSHFEYAPFGAYLTIPKEDMVHIRFGVDEANPLQGVSPLAAVYREIVTDNSYSDYAAGLGQHSGMPPIAFTPKVVSGPNGEKRATLDKDTAQTLAEKISERFRKRPGEPFMFSGAVELLKLGIDPDKMALLEVRAMPETRIPASFGLPVLVLQLYTGILKSTFSNMDTAVKQAWRGCIIPTQRIFASAYSRKCLSLYRVTQRGDIIEWTTGAVQELREDNLEARKQAESEYAADIITLEETRAEGGRQTSPQIVAALQAQQLAKRQTGAIEPLIEGESDTGQTVTIAGKTYRLIATKDDEGAKKKALAASRR